MHPGDEKLIRLTITFVFIIDTMIYKNVQHDNDDCIIASH